jgi:hypothetical protein
MVAAQKLQILLRQTLVALQLLLCAVEEERSCVEERRRS